MPFADPSIVAEEPGSLVFGQPKAGPSADFGRASLPLPNAALDAVVQSARQFLDEPSGDGSVGVRLAATGQARPGTPTTPGAGVSPQMSFGVPAAADVGTPTSSDPKGATPSAFDQALRALGLLERGGRAALDLFGTRAPTRGETGQTSLSDQVRSGPSPSAFSTFAGPGDVAATASAGGSAFTPSGDLVPFQIPSDILSGASGGSAAAAPAEGAALPVSSAVPDTSSSLGTAGTALAAAKGAADIGFIAASSNLSDADKAALAANAAGMTAANVAGYGIPGLVDQVIQLAGGPSQAQFFADVFGIGPSKAWQSFGGRLGETLALEGSATENFVNQLPATTSPADLAAAIATLKSSIGQRVGGFGAGSGPYDLPVPPGATGTKHEGGLRVDFGPIYGRLQQDVTDRLALFDSLDRMKAESDARQAAAARAQAEAQAQQAQAAQAAQADATRRLGLGTSSGATRLGPSSDDLDRTLNEARQMLSAP